MTAPGAPLGGGLVQPTLTGLEPLPPVERPVATSGSAGLGRRAATTDRPARRRYWSVRDLSRRLWVGRGYELLRELIRSGILPATRSARSWWIDDDDATSLMAAFDDRAGKVRAFGGLEAWLRARCYVAPLTPEAETLTRLTRSGFAWRGQLYLPKNAWTVEADSNGGVQLRHRSGAIVEATGADEAAAPTAPLAA